ncbi:GGDEF domain-containing protein [Halalkalibacter krulwichiae]|uniref:Putative diguanylate cyclase AdrA n=1 Tax=Halalkalibacter krulwichiae TaxID=199441 RepID=A0A1X9MER0_9BACI|nr:diguanylate cyclase [Halalkalibacter krulwichiae]ARK28922.1 putative diguanylate cyclase AdrA [Halalkalibacter krulwichiae]
MVLQSILANIAIILMMHLCLVLLMNNKEKFSKWTYALGGIFLVSFAVIAMFYLPIKYGHYQFDMRMIPLVFYGYRKGWKYVIPVVVIVSLWRLGIGGEGALPGVIFGMVIPVGFALLVRNKKKPVIGLSTLVFLVTACWLISDLPIIMILPDGWNVFSEIAIYRFLSFNLVALLLYFFIYSSEKEIALKKQLQFLAERDPLTGLYNIRHFLSKVKALCGTEEKKYILMIDLDHFKKINDTYGHLTGDDILKNVAELLDRTATSDADVDAIAGRYGGEEFIIFIKEKAPINIIEKVEAIRREIETATFYTHDKTELSVTVSIGVCRVKDASTIRETIERADCSLYESKKNGRNKIHFADKDVG